MPYYPRIFLNGGFHEGRIHKGRISRLKAVRLLRFRCPLCHLHDRLRRPLCGGRGRPLPQDVDCRGGTRPLGYPVRPDDVGHLLVDDRAHLPVFHTPGPLEAGKEPRGHGDALELCHRHLRLHQELSAAPFCPRGRRCRRGRVRPGRVQPDRRLLPREEAGPHHRHLERRDPPRGGRWDDTGRHHRGPLRLAARLRDRGDTGA